MERAFREDGTATVMRGQLMQNFAEGILRSRWWRGRFGRTCTIHVTAGNRTRPLGGNVNLRPRLALDKYDDLELLKCMAWHMIEPDAAWHGREFAKLYLELVQRFVDPDAATELRGLYVEHGVKYRAKRVLSPEALVAAQARAATLVDARAEAVVSRMEDDYRV